MRSLLVELSMQEVPKSRINLENYGAGFPVIYVLRSPLNMKIRSSQLMSEARYYFQIWGLLEHSAYVFEKGHEVI